MLRLAHRFLVAVLITSLIALPMLALPVPPNTKTIITKTAVRKAGAEPPDNRPSNQLEHVLVKWQDSGNPGLRQTILANWSAENAVQRLAERTDIVRLTLKPGLSAEVAAHDLAQLDHIVEWAEVDAVVKSGGGSQKAAGRRQGQLFRQAYLTTTNLTKALHAPRSSRPVVAVIDTGLATNHPAFRHQFATTPTPKKFSAQRSAFSVAKPWNFVSQNNDVTDDNGHGTQMAGIIARLNPNITLLPLKALDAQGVGAVSAVIAALDYAVQQQAEVILCSFGTERNSKALLEAIKRAESAGVVVITAAGRSGLGRSRASIPADKWGRIRIPSRPNKALFTCSPMAHGAIWRTIPPLRNMKAMMPVICSLTRPAKS